MFTANPVKCDYMWYQSPVAWVDHRAKKWYRGSCLEHDPHIVNDLFWPVPFLPNLYKKKAGYNLCSRLILSLEDQSLRRYAGTHNFILLAYLSFSLILGHIVGLVIVCNRRVILPAKFVFILQEVRRRSFSMNNKQLFAKITETVFFLNQGFRVSNTESVLLINIGFRV